MALKGQKMSEETRAKISVALKGNRNGEKRSIGQKRTPEMRARMSAGRRAGSEARGPLSYSAVHKRLRKDRGTPSLCEHCGTTTAKKFEWAYTGPGHQSGSYSANLADYIRLCTSCHIKLDGHPSTKARSRRGVIANDHIETLLCDERASQAGA